MQPAKMYDGNLSVPEPGSPLTLYTGVDQQKYPRAPAWGRNVVVTGKPGNKGVCILGGVKCEAAEATRSGQPITPNQTLPPMDVCLREVSLDVVNANDGVYFAYLGPDQISEPNSRGAPRS